MGASHADRDGRFLLVVLVAMNALAIAAVFELGGVLRVFAFLSLLAVLVTGSDCGRREQWTDGLEGSTKLREWRSSTFGGVIVEPRFDRRLHPQPPPDRRMVHGATVLKPTGPSASPNGPSTPPPKRNPRVCGLRDPVKRLMG